MDEETAKNALQEAKEFLSKSKHYLNMLEGTEG
jgi:hypothetical protein